MTDLLTRLQDASEGSRELDAEIGAEIRYFSGKAEDWMRGWQGPIRPYLEKPGHIACWHTDGRMSVWWSVPCYTTSIDAALTLVQGGMAWSVSEDDTATACINMWGAISEEARAPTPALAICIAALQAQQSTKAEVA